MKKDLNIILVQFGMPSNFFYIVNCYFIPLYFYGNLNWFTYYTMIARQYIDNRPTVAKQQKKQVHSSKIFR